MKKLSLALIAMVICITSGMLTSCSSNDIYDYVPDNADFVVSTDAKAILENADCKVGSNGEITLSEPLQKLMNGESIAQIKGVDLSRMVLFADLNDDEDCVCGIARIINEDDLRKMLRESDVNEAGNIYYSDIETFVIDKDVVIYVNRMDKNGDFVNDLKARAKKNPIAAWKKDELKDGTLGLIMNMEKILELSEQVQGIDMKEMYKSMGFGEVLSGYMTAEAELKGAKLSMDFKTVDKNGKKIKPGIDVTPMNKKLLDYTTKYDVAVLLSGLPSADYLAKILAQAGLPNDQVSVAKQVYDSFTGLMMAGGPINITQYNKPDGWHAVIAASLKDGKAREYFNLAALMAPQIGIPVENTGDVLSVTYLGIKAYLTVDGDNLVASLNLPVEKNGEKSPIKATEFDGTASMIIDIPARSPQITLLSIPFGIKLDIQGEVSETEMNVKLIETDGNFLGTMIDYIAQTQGL